MRNPKYFSGVVMVAKTVGAAALGLVSATGVGNGFDCACIDGMIATVAALANNPAFITR